MSAKSKFLELVEASKAISIQDAMQICADARVVTMNGDFETAADASQMFGELLGIWAGATWQAIGSPEKFALVDMSRGDGKVMADLLRASSTVIGFNQGAHIVMIAENSAAEEAQRQLLAAYLEAGFNIQWAESWEDVPKLPSLIIANEKLSGMPIAQYQKAKDAWHELELCMQNNVLTKQIGQKLIEPGSLPIGHEKMTDGAIFEKSDAREKFCAQLARHVAECGGAAILIDFGHNTPKTGDSLMAIIDEKFVTPFEEDGAKLSAHVDFSSLFAAVKNQDMATVTPPMEQGEFLVRMGLVERARQLGQEVSPQEQAKIRLDIERIAGEGDGTRSTLGGMGVLHKVMIIGQPKLLPPPFNAGENGDVPAPKMVN